MTEHEGNRIVFTFPICFRGVSDEAIPELASFKGDDLAIYAVTLTGEGLPAAIDQDRVMGD